MAEYKLSYTAADINEKLGKVSQLSEDTASLQSDVVSLQADIQTVSRVGHEHSWSELKDKPVVFEGSDTLTWDGNTEGRAYEQSTSSYKVHDIFVRAADVVEGSTALFLHNGTPYTVENLTAQGNETMTVITGNTVGLEAIPQVTVAVSVEKEFAEANGMVGGTYLYASELGCASSLTIPGYTGFGSEKIAPSHLYQPDWEQSDENAPDYIKNKPLVFVGGDTLTWDGNTEGVLTIDTEFGLMCKVSNVVPTIYDFANGVKIVSNDGTFDVIDGNFIEVDPSGQIHLNPTVFFVTEEAVGKDINGVTFTEAGLYFIIFNGFHATSLTIPGFNGFVKEQINPEYLPKLLHVIHATSVSPMAATADMDYNQIKAIVDNGGVPVCVLAQKYHQLNFISDMVAKFSNWAILGDHVVVSHIEFYSYTTEVTISESAMQFTNA